jgi:S-layer homology domain
MKVPTLSIPARISMALGIATLVAGAARAQSYGGQPQVLTVGVSEFRGVDGASSSVSGTDGYLSNPAPGTYSYYLAPLPLPEGASIQRICLFANDSDTAQFGYVQAYLVGFKLVPTDGAPASYAIPDASAISIANVGYQYQCSADFSYTLRSMTDIDGDGTPDSVVHYLEVYLPYPSQNDLSFGGAQILWKRQVSDSPATPTFGDVPSTHPFFQFIEALSSSGITTGCGSGNFCPNAPLTRGQMAVFLGKALGLHWSSAP